MQSCSVLDSFIPAPLQINTATLRSTSTQLPTRTPTPTRTLTPTPPSTSTLIPAAPTFTPFLLFNTEATGFAPIPTSYAPLGGFESVTNSNGKIFYDICQPNFTKLIVKVEYPDEIVNVYFFFRLESVKKPGDTTKWYGTITDNDGAGYFIYTLRARNIPERRNFLRAWVQYQFVAENKNQELVGRTQVYTRTLMLEACK